MEMGLGLYWEEKEIEKGEREIMWSWGGKDCEKKWRRGKNNEGKFKKF